MKTFSALLALCEGIHRLPVAQRPVTWGFDALNKKTRCRWFETASHPLWRGIAIPIRENDRNYGTKTVTKAMLVYTHMFLFQSQWRVSTHCGLVTQWRYSSGSTIAQVMGCCLMAPSHYLNQCWLITKGVLRNSPRAISQEELKKSIHKIDLKFALLKPLPCPTGPMSAPTLMEVIARTCFQPTVTARTGSSMATRPNFFMGTRLVRRPRRPLNWSPHDNKTPPEIILIILKGRFVTQVMDHPIWCKPNGWIGNSNYIHY